MYDLSTIGEQPEFAHYPKSRVEKFLYFHKNNPHVLNQLEQLTFETVASGRKRYGFKTIYAVLRWKHDLSTSGDKFKLNDFYMSFYARALILKNPELKNFFEFRTREFKQVS